MMHLKADRRKYIADLLPENERRQQVRYMEHLTLGFSTFTYIGYFN